MKFRSILALVLGLSLHVFSQARLKGTILNKENTQPVAYATIIITDPATNKTVNGGVANDKGIFEIKDLNKGKYNLTIDFIGFTRQSINISITGGLQDLGTIYMTAAGRSLNEVVVTSRAPTIENKVDRIVYNVAADITSQGGVATDVLKKVPQVTVDVDGNVELQGNPNIRFLINGKPSAMFGNSLSDALASIPASQIQSIEAITSPGAKYDAQGTGGIINIVLKENHFQGINGSLSLSAGTRLENGAFNLNMRKNNFGMNFFFNGNEQLKSATPSIRHRNAADSSSRLVQDGLADFTRHSYQTGISFDWDLGKTDNLSGGISYSFFGNHSVGNTLQQQWTKDDSLNTNVLADTRNRINSVDWNIAYRKKFSRAGEELNILYSASYGNPYISYVQSQFYTGALSPYGGMLSNTPGRDDQHNISADYKFSFLETGVKATLRDLSNPSNAYAYDAGKDTYLPDPTQTYAFHYRMNIYAAYASAKFSIGDALDVVAGGRYEYTSLQMRFEGKNVPSYSNFLPAINLSHSLGNGRYIKLAYTRRMERPDKELNPFLNISDPYNITTGNPYLKPEIGNNFELGYNTPILKSGNLYVAFSERLNTNDLKTYTAYYNSYMVGDSLYKDVSVTYRANIGREYNTGVIITSSLPITRNLNLRENLMLFNRHVVDTLANGIKTDGLNWRLNINAAYSLPADIIAEAFGEFRSSFNSIQGRVPHSVNYTIAVRKQFMHKNASLGITATNPFNQYINQLTTIQTPVYTSSYLRKIPYRSFGVSFTYKFGKLQLKKEKEHGDDFLNNLPS